MEVVVEEGFFDADNLAEGLMWGSVLGISIGVFVVIFDFGVVLGCFVGDNVRCLAGKPVGSFPLPEGPGRLMSSGL